MTALNAGRLVSLLREGVADGLSKGAARVQAVTIPLTPVETGDLRSDAFVEAATPADLTSQVGFTLEYAIYQHEDLSYRHDDGQAKFLETATQSTTREVGDIVAASAARALGRG